MGSLQIEAEPGQSLMQWSQEVSTFDFTMPSVVAARSNARNVLSLHFR